MNSLWPAVSVFVRRLHLIAPILFLCLCSAGMCWGNLLTDGSFEQGQITCPGWSVVTGCVFTGSDSSDGSWCLEHTNTGSAYTDYVTNGPAGGFFFQPIAGAKYTLSFDAKVVSGTGTYGGDTYVYVRCIDESYTQVLHQKTVTVSYFAYHVWETFTTSLYVVPGTAHVDVVVCPAWNGGLYSSVGLVQRFDHFVLTDETGLPADGDCESLTTGQPGWKSLTGGVVFTTEDASEGIASLKFVCTPGATNRKAQNVGYTTAYSDGFYTAEGGSEYTLTWDAKTLAGFSAGGDAVVQLRFLDADYSPLELEGIPNAFLNVATVPGSHGSWETFHGSVVAPEEAVYWDVIAYIGYAGLSSGTLYLDDFEMSVLDLGHLPLNGDCEDSFYQLGVGPGFWNLTNISYTQELASTGSTALKVADASLYCFFENVGFSDGGSPQESWYVAEPGHDYTLTFDCRTSPNFVAGGDHLLRIVWKDAGNQELSYNDVLLTPTDGWERFSGTFTAPANAQFWTVQAHIGYMGYSSGSLYLDEICVTDEGPHPLDPDFVQLLGDMGNAWISGEGSGRFDADVDFYPDGMIDMKDFSFLAGRWNTTGVTYFVSAATGDDMNPGTASEPFETIGRASEVMFAGDTCLIRSGTYRETVRPKRSGRADAPIRYAAYPGERPMISGADVFTGSWSVYSGSIYQSSIPVGRYDPPPFYQLFVDGVKYTQARWPNAGVHEVLDAPMATADGGASDTVYDAALPAGNWQGAKIFIVSGWEWFSFTKTITGYTAGSHLTIANPDWTDEFGRNEGYWPEAGDKYYLFGSLDGLDMATEWVLKKTGFYNYDCYLWCEGNDSPASHLVEVKKRTHAFDLSDRDHIRVDGFDMFAATVLMQDSDYCLVENCHIKYPDYLGDTNGRWTSHHEPNKHATRMSGSFNELRRCGITNAAANGIYDYGRNNRVTDCIVRNANYMALDGGVLYVHETARGGEYVGNTMSGSGRFVVYPIGRGLTIRNNHLYGAGYMTKDCGVIYIIRSGIGDWCEIAYNWVHDNFSEQFPKGIYLDHENANWLVHHNLIWNIPETAIIMSIPIATAYVYNNTILGTCSEVFSYYDQGLTADHSTCKAVNNLHKCIFGWLVESPPQYAVDKHHNGNYSINPDGTPAGGSGAIDAGYFIPGINDGYAGSAPDIGCYEDGHPMWTAGADWTLPGWMLDQE